MKGSIAFFIVLFAGSAFAAALLTTTDIEQITGLKEVHTIPRGAPPTAQADLNFVDQRGEMLLTVSVGASALYDKAKQPRKVDVGGQTMEIPSYHAEVRGLGDEAFDAPPGNMQRALYVRKGTRSLALTRFIDPKTKQPALTMDQLKALASIVLERLSDHSD
ncbi:MAG: hypothetical protein HY282_01775 [Nitrospirae bacterium]|nr:hypothetical protein [Candidatus Manganitrophaceae bacterium]